jgi:hypothetical protein
MTASENLRLRGPEADVREALGLAELYTAWERVLLCVCLLAQGFRSSSRSADVVLHVGNAVDQILSVKACGLIEGVIALWARENVRPTPRLKVVRRGGTRTSRKGSTYYRLSRVNDNPVRSEAVEDNVLDASTGDDGALGGGTNVMLDGFRVASTRDVGVAIATNCQRRLRRHEVRRLFNHYMGVIVMFC